jgi:hypothetical protein
MYKEDIIMKRNVWTNFVRYVDVGHKIDGCFLIRISDDVLDEENWTIDGIVVEKGKVERQTNVFPGCYTLPNMIGWSMGEVVEWTCNQGSMSTHPHNTNDIMKIV